MLIIKAHKPFKISKMQFNVDAFQFNGRVSCIRITFDSWQHTKLREKTPLSPSANKLVYHKFK